MNEQKTKSKSGVRRFLEKWLVSILEFAGFALLISKIIPGMWLKTGWPLFVLLSIALLGLLIINYRLAINLSKFSDQKENEFSNRLSTLMEENIRLEKKSRYAEVIPMLNIAFQELHNAMRRDHLDKKIYHEYFEKCCQGLEKVFTKVTGVECHVCIKATAFPNNQIPSPTRAEKNSGSYQVKTYCRSLQDLSYRVKIDQTSVPHLITENTDFEYIFRKKDDCFFCNDLAKLEEYKNSSIKLKNHGSCIFFPRGTSFSDKIEKWPLPYRATFVAPILPIIKETKDEHIILGLLCVDCVKPDVFNKELDSHIMIGCADGIYNSFKKLFQPHTTSVKSKTNEHDKH
jgi:hypothetical protein